MNWESSVAAALDAVPRERFIPDMIWVIREDQWLARGWTELRRQDDPQGWRAEVQSGDAVVTQIDESRTWPTSSCSSVEVVSDMLHLAQVGPGSRVLEIGTGTGYNAACLAELGADVTTVEIDRETADHAKRVLASLGYDRVRVVTDDGAYGVPDQAPFHRVIATAAVHTVPYAWVQQCHSGGIIVCPYTGTGHEGGMLVLRVHDGTARGTFRGEAAFMPLRGQGLIQAEIRAIVTQPHLTVHVGPDGQRLYDTSETPGV